MPAYNLTQTEYNIVTSWLGEEGGYLDAAKASTGTTAREALAADAGLDVTEWIRSNTPHADTVPSDWDQCSMIWWARANDQVNIPTPGLPAEKELWAATLRQWEVEINDAFNRSDVNARNGTKIDLYNLDGVLFDDVPAGSHLTAQLQIIDKVATLLE